MIVCAAVVGQLNNPLYLGSFTPAAEEDAFKMHTIVHCSLDAVEEKVANLARPAGDVGGDGYLGLLYVVDDLRVYGYVTNTKVKLLLVVDDPVVKDDELKSIFRRFHTALVDALSNPFYTPNTVISSQRFDASVRALSLSPLA